MNPLRKVYFVVYVLRYWLLLAALFAMGCGSGGSLTEPAVPGVRGKTSDVVVNLNAGWNAVGFKAPQLTSVTANSAVLGAAWWTGTAYSVGGFGKDELNAAGIRRGFWVYCSGGTSFSYTGESSDVYVDLDQNGYQLVTFCTEDDVPGALLKATRNGQELPIGSALLTTFYEVGPDNQYTAVDVSAGGVLKGGRPYWVYALTSQGTVRLTVSAPAPSPGVLASPEAPVATGLRFVASPVKVTAGAPFSVTVQAVDAANALVPNASGTVVLSGPRLVGVTSAPLSGGQAALMLAVPAAAFNVSLTATLTGLPAVSTAPFTVSPELVSRQNDSATAVGPDFGQTVAWSAGLGAAPVVSADGRYVVFATTTSPTQIWVRDRQLGTVTQASSNLGNPGQMDCQDPSISANGRYVVFTSAGQFGTAFQQNGGFKQVFLRDLTGPTMTLISRVTGQQGVNADSFFPAVASNGAVVWETGATDQLAGTTGTQVYRRLLGSNTVQLVSHKNGAAAGVGSTPPCHTPVCSADGRYVAFYSANSDVLGTMTTGGAQQIFRRDMNVADGVELVSRKFGGGMAEGGAGNSLACSISADGNRIAFQSINSPDLVPSGPSANSPYVRDMTGGNTTVLSVNQAGMVSPFGGGLPKISTDGDAVVFCSIDTNLVTPAPPAGSYAFIRRLSTGTTRLASVAPVFNNRAYLNGDGSMCFFLTTSSGATTLGLPSIFTQVFCSLR